MSKAPLVLAIEPDLRQAAIVKRVVRERVLADVVVVDSRDAAIEAIGSAIPDVLLVSALLSPRDEDDLVAHLRTLEGAAHLQTHTIPQLASALGPGESGGGGLLSAFRRKKQPAAAPAGCDPDLFADEILLYLQNAAEKKRQAAESGTVLPLSIGRKVAEDPSPVVEQAPEPATGSSWSSPFEWRPTTDRRAAPPPTEAETPAPEPEPAIEAMPFVPEPEPELEPLVAAAAFVPEPSLEPPVAAIAFVPETQAEQVREPELVREPEPEPEPPMVVAPPIAAPAPRVVKVHEPAPFHVWARQDAPAHPSDAALDELHGLLARLGVPDSVASVRYPEGVRIRRLRVVGAGESRAALQGAAVLSRRMIAELRGSDASA